MSRVAPIPVQSGFSRIAEALADPAREAIVCALAGGKAIPAGELAFAAGISPQSATAHLQKLVEAKILTVCRQGRFRYYQIADDDVVVMVEGLVNFAAKSEARSERRYARLPSDLQQSRTCYRHLAGRLGVALAETLIGRGYVSINGRDGIVTTKGLAWCQSEQIDFHPTRAASVRLCIDWTERLPHLAGAFPNALLRRLMDRKLLRPGQTPRALHLTPAGRIFFHRLGVQVDF